MWWLRCSFSLILLLHWQLKSVQSDEKTSRCDKRTLTTFTTRCRTCSANYYSRCRYGSTKITTGYGIRGCRLYFRPWGGGFSRIRRVYPPYRRVGCYHKCQRIVVEAACCPNFWGRDCRPCPGVQSGKSPCYGKGICSDLITGNGTCHCNDGFEGFACEKCSNKAKFGKDCQQDCSCKNGTCSNLVESNGTCQQYTCKIGYHGENCDIYEPHCAKMCGNNSHCVKTNTTVCKCNPGYRGNGSQCEEIDPCKEFSSPCSINSTCHYKGPGQHQCVCKNGYTGDGLICTAIDPCQNNNGNCAINARCNYQGPGKSNCSCLPGYENHVPGVGCTMIDLCKTEPCGDVNAICSMMGANNKRCRCKYGYVGNGTVCYGNILQRIDDLNRDGEYKNQFTHVKNLITRHSNLSRQFTSRGSFTVFLPTDTWIDRNLTSKQRSTIINNFELTQRLFLLHSVSRTFTASSPRQRLVLSTLGGAYATFNNDNGSFYYQLSGHNVTAKIIAPNNVAWNGILHILDRPAWLPDFNNIQTTSSLKLWKIIERNPKLRVLREYIQIAGMRSDLEAIFTRGMTLFAPVNEAFKQLNTNDSEFLKTPQGKRKLRIILRNHIFYPKMGIFHLSKRYSVSSSTGQRIRVWKRSSGAVYLNYRARLTETNIPASNGILHMIGAVLVPSSVIPIIQPKCDLKTTRYTRCTRCSSFARCPPGTVQSGSRLLCYYWYSRGCRLRCVSTVKRCCSGFYGSNCSPCRGPVGNPCFGNGKCFDGLRGNGTCLCNSSFSGTACELCRDSKTFGPSCNRTCTCAHGICSSGIRGNGSCIAGSCGTGYHGKECASKMTQCGDKIIPCSNNSRCYLSGNISSCKCNGGYEGDGLDCYEIDRCKEADRGGCHAHAICEKTGPGERSCTCDRGWTGDGIYCTPINNCIGPSRGYCHKYAKCIFTGPAENDCECLPGYEGDGSSCREKNSCLFRNGNCSPFATCTRTGPNLNNCTCRFNYIGNGYICFPSMSVVMNNRTDIRRIYNLIVKSNLVRYFTKPGENITVFLPSDIAMDNLNDSDKNQLAVRNNLLDFLSSNMASGQYTSRRLENISRLQSLSDDFNISISLSNNKQLVIGGQAKVIVRDITASNGIIHIVDKVLLRTSSSRPQKENLTRVLCNETDFKEFCASMKTYNLSSLLESNCSYCTIFAPNNEAFGQLTHRDFHRLNSTDIKYHITDHYLHPSTVLDGQQFSTLAGIYYVVALEKKKSISVNGIKAIHYHSGHTYVIYNISSVLKPKRNYCFRNGLGRVLQVTCGYCFNVRRSCPRGYRYSGIDRCLRRSFSFFSRVGCRPRCRKIVKVTGCCPGFWGKDCNACPGENNNPCFGNGLCTATGACACHPRFAGTACERCADGHYGKNCTNCNCFGNATCDQTNGLCICPNDKKGEKCDKEANITQCGEKNITCHKHASCNKTCQCDYGFTGNGTDCVRLDPCRTNNGGCSAHAKCSWVGNRKRTCKCKKNYEGDGFYCHGVNPCSEKNTCDRNAHCEYFRPGRRICICKIGYTGDGSSCSRFDPCSLNNGGCSLFATCDFSYETENITCKCRSGMIGNGTVCTGNLMESLQSNPDWTSFSSRLRSSLAQQILSPQNTFSIVVPINSAFDSPSKRKRRNAVLEITDMKNYLVSCVSITEKDVSTPGKSFVTVAGTWLNITSPRVINNKVKILSVSNTANGVILTVDKLLDTSSSLSTKDMSFIDVAKTGSYGQFIKLLTIAGMRGVVSPRHYQPFTMFWPTDEAIGRLPDDIKKRLFSGNYNDELRTILKYHIIEKTKLTTVDILDYTGGLSRRTQEGASLYISCKGHQGDIYINDRSRIVRRDIKFLEGIAYGISEVLLPPGVAGRCDEVTYEVVKTPCTNCAGKATCPRGGHLTNIVSNSSCYVQGYYTGCSTTCLKRNAILKCCKNFYGPDCRACPSGARKPCSGRGYCYDTLIGNGSCTCEKPYIGTACESCASSDARCAIVPRICISRKNPCSVFATCDPIRKELCQCINGYEGDGFYCQPIDPCQKNNGNCDANAVCTYLGPKSVRCRCRPGYIGNGRSCTALPPTHPCWINNGNCHVHANCEDKDGAVVCTCRKGFVGNGIYCGGTLLQVINDIEDLSELAKNFLHLRIGVEGNDLIRALNSEMTYTVFAPINSGMTLKQMTIYDLKNHIIQGRPEFIYGSTKTFVSLADNNITVVMSKNGRGKVNNIANIVGEYQGINGVIHLVDHDLPYVKPTTTPPPATPHPATTKSGDGKTTTTAPSLSAPKAHSGSQHVATIGISVGVVFLVLFIVVVLIFYKRRRSSTAVRYNKDFDSILFDSEPYTEEDHDDDGDYQHQELQHPSSVDDERTCLTNPTYDVATAGVDEHLEMTETSSIIPLTEHDSNAKDGSSQCK